MDFEGKYRIAANRQQVWEGLNDPEILKQAIPGCQELTKNGDTDFSAVVIAKLGPVKAKFSGAVSLEDLNPPESYTLRGEGKGGMAGFGKGAAKVTLLEDGPDATILAYTAEASIGGKLAQLGSRLMKGAVKKIAGDFFSNFAASLNAEAEELSIEEDASENPATA